MFTHIYIQRVGGVSTNGPPRGVKEKPRMCDALRDKAFCARLRRLVETGLLGQRLEESPPAK